MNWKNLIFLTIAVTVSAAPQNQIPQQQVSASQQVAQNRDAPVYPDTGYSTGFAATNQAYGAPAASQASYGVPAQGGYAAAPSTQQGGYAQPSGNTGYYYYYYPVQEQKGDGGYQQHAAPAKESYAATDSYGIDPLGIIAVLAVAGLVIAGLALLFPGWAYVRSDENVYYRSIDGSSSFLGLSKDDYHTLTSLVLAAIEGEDCIEKMMCDAGKLVKKVKKAESFLRVMEDLAPSNVSTTIKKLRTAMKRGEECKSLSCTKKIKTL